MASIDLDSLLVPLDGLSDVEAFEAGRTIFGDVYTDNVARGTITMCNGELVHFFADRYDHAFMTSRHRATRAYSKDTPARPRIERVRWIKEILEGRVENVECRHVPHESGRWEPPKYIVLAWGQSYIIWLEGRKDGAWRFSSAYPTSTNDMRRYTKISRTVWRR